MTPNDITGCWQKLRQSIAQPELWLTLARSYAACDLPWQAGYAARQALRVAACAQPLLALRDVANNDSQLGRAALAESDALIERYSAWLEKCPGDWLSWLYLARLQEMNAPALQASASLQQALSLEPIPGESLHWIGVWRLNAGDAMAAVASLSGLLNIRPVRSGSMMYLGMALLQIGNILAAEKAFARASLSDNPEFLLSLSAKVYAANYWQEAISVLQKALGIQPGEIRLWLALAKIQSEVYALADCQQSLARVQQLAPGNAEAQLLKAGLQGRMGDAKQHLALLQLAYETGGDPLSRLASSIAMTALYHDALPAAEVAMLHRRLCEPIEAAVKQKTQFNNLRSTDRRLRLGFVTGDLHRQHPVNIFMLPLLQQLDHARFEIFIYHSGTMHDEYTRQAKGCADGWLEAAALDDAALQCAIIADQNDILIDLAGHTSSHRLGVFALRAAPVQATFLGYPHSTGLGAMDWLIGDGVVSPAAHAHLYREGLAQMPGSVFCWAPVDEYPLPEPRAPDAPVVFGSFNNAMKLSQLTIALWAAVLHAVPGSLLLLKAPALKDSSVQARLAVLFAEQGVPLARLKFLGPDSLADMMQQYGNIDIALDPTPYNGGTTSLQALWMGVPVITLTGNNFVGRMGSSFMHMLNQPTWVASNQQTYVEAAAALAANCASIRSSRALLREEMAGSGLCDIKSYAKDFETLLSKMWTNYCVQGTARLISVAAHPLPTNR